MTKNNYYERNGCSIYVNHWLAPNIDFFLKRIAHNWDFVGLCIGEEGDGKTTLILQLALYMDENLTLDNCVFSIKDFSKAVDELPKGSSIIWDESDELDATNLRKVLLAVKQKFKRIRDQNYKIWLITPTFFDLSKYFVMTRIQCMIRVSADMFTRGIAYFYTKDRMRELYIKGKKTDWDIHVVKGNFSFDFRKLPPNFPIDMKDYDEKKHAATRDITDELVTVTDRLVAYRKDCVKRYFNQTHNILKIKTTYKHAAYVFGVTRQTISTDIGGSKAVKVRENIDVSNLKIEVDDE